MQGFDFSRGLIGLQVLGVARALLDECPQPRRCLGDHAAHHHHEAQQQYRGQSDEGWPGDNKTIIG